MLDKLKPSSEEFWADQLAKQSIERAKKEKNEVTCRSAASPSGAKHIGNLFDVLKSYIVYEAVVDKKFPARFVLTHDDRDPLRKIPPRLPDLDGKWHTTEAIEKKMLKHLGEPYSRAPDPFGCCSSWSEHFAKVWENGIRSLNVDMKTFFNEDLYNQGKFVPYIVMALKNIEASRRVIMKFQETKEPDYIPFDVICENCGKITAKAQSFDLENKTIDYICSGKELAGKYHIEGCGHSGTVSFENGQGGKLPWSFEWPAQWMIFKTTFEPFGKEHAEGSWPRCSAVCREVYNGNPPIPHIYEFLLVDGKKMAAREGNAYLVQDIMKILEPEVFTYFYTKRSGKQRNLDLKNIQLLVDEFERAEQTYFDIKAGKKIDDMKEANQMKRMYELSFGCVGTPKEKPLRIPYTFASLITQIVPENRKLDSAIQLLTSTGHITEEPTKEQRQSISRRLELAKNWIEMFAPEQKISLNEHCPEIRLSSELKSALTEIQTQLTSVKTDKDLEYMIYEAAKANRVQPKILFTTLYQILISKERGPRLAPFIIAIGKDRVKEILKECL